MPATTPRRAAHGADGRAGPELLVVEVSLGSSSRDHDLRVRFLDRRYRLLRLGTDGDVHTAQALVRRWSELADQVAVNGGAEAAATGLLDHDPAEATARLVASAVGGTATDGHRLREVLQEWAVRRVQYEMPGYFSNARTVVLGSDHARTVRVLREYTDNLHLEAPPVGAGPGRRLGGVPVLGRVARLA